MILDKEIKTLKGKIFFSSKTPAKSIRSNEGIKHFDHEFQKI